MIWEQINLPNNSNIMNDSQKVEENPSNSNQNQSPMHLVTVTAFGHLQAIRQRAGCDHGKGEGA
jgi:hypothetical protein